MGVKVTLGKYPIRINGNLKPDTSPTPISFFYLHEHSFNLIYNAILREIGNHLAHYKVVQVSVAKKINLILQTLLILYGDMRLFIIFNFIYIFMIFNNYNKVY